MASPGRLVLGWCRGRLLLLKGFGGLLPLCLNPLPCSDNLGLDVEAAAATACLALWGGWCIGRKEVVVILSRLRCERSTASHTCFALCRPLLTLTRSSFSAAVAFFRLRISFASSSVIRCVLLSPSVTLFPVVELPAMAALPASTRPARASGEGQRLAGRDRQQSLPPTHSWQPVDQPRERPFRRSATPKRVLGREAAVQTGEEAGLSASLTCNGTTPAPTMMAAQRPVAAAVAPSRRGRCECARPIAWPGVEKLLAAAGRDRGATPTRHNPFQTFSGAGSRLLLSHTLTHRGHAHACHGQTYREQHRRPVQPWYILQQRRPRQASPCSQTTRRHQGEHGQASRRPAPIPPRRRLLAVVGILVASTALQRPVRGKEAAGRGDSAGA